MRGTIRRRGRPSAVVIALALVVSCCGDGDTVDDAPDVPDVVELSASPAAATDAADTGP